MSTTQHAVPVSPVPASLGARAARQPVVRILLATLAMVLPVAAVLVFANVVLEKSMRVAWPQLLAAALCVLGYRLYVTKIERRVPDELGTAGAARETGAGLAWGAALSLGVIGALAAAGAFQIVGSNSWTVIFKPVAELVLVALFEELLFRAVLLRILQAALGTRWALALSSLLFALAHFPNDGVSALGLVITVAAGAMFGAAYLKTGRIWLAAGLHFAWNSITGTVFSLPVSGGAAKGWIIGRLSGPEWLSGGNYGIEASAVTLLAVIAVAAALGGADGLRRAAWRRRAG
jgi:membrane protease YdiL (CAAX protease family)